jgi:hypothetical protein
MLPLMANRFSYYKYEAVEKYFLRKLTSSGVYSVHTVLSVTFLSFLESAALKA